MRTFLYKVFLTVISVFVLSSMATGKDIVITPFGQSPDGMMIRVVLKKIGFSADLSKTLTSTDLKDERVLILAVGGSSKGMGAAGLDKDEEIKRVEQLVAAAKKKGTKIIVMHIGGMARRGKLTDIFLEKAVPLADKVIIVEDGNSDGLFTGFLKGTKIDMLSAKTVRKTSDPLKEVLTNWGIKSGK